MKNLLLILLFMIPCYAGQFNDNGATVGNDDLVGSSRITKQGEQQVLLYNKTGHTSKRGEVLVTKLNYDMAVTTTPTKAVLVCGVCASTGVADGGLIWVTTGGMAQFLLVDSSGSVAGNWIKTSNVANGRASTSVAEPAQPSFSTTEHDQEIGHSLETVAGGTDKLFWGMVHFR